MVEMIATPIAAIAAASITLSVNPGRRPGLRKLATAASASMRGARSGSRQINTGSSSVGNFEEGVAVVDL